MKIRSSIAFVLKKNKLDHRNMFTNFGPYHEKIRNNCVKLQNDREAADVISEEDDQNESQDNFYE